MFKKILFAGLLAISSSAVMAVPITGQIDFGGTASTTIAVNEFTEIDFNTIIVLDATGSFSSVAVPSVATMPDPWTVAPMTNNLWTAGNFSFDLQTITQNDGVTIMGSGIIKNAVDGFTDTFGTWSFTKQNGEAKSSFSATTVPAPGVALLLGLGLLGLGFARNKRKA